MLVVFFRFCLLFFILFSLVLISKPTACRSKQENNKVSVICNAAEDQTEKNKKVGVD